MKWLITSDGIMALPVTMQVMGSRLIAHIAFWLGYYVLFSLIWMRPELGYLPSFYLEFVLLPPRMLAVYAVLFVLLPWFIQHRKVLPALLAYAGILLIAAILQRLFGHFFYDQLLLGLKGALYDPGALVRSIMLINSTVLFVSAVKIFVLYLRDKETQQQVSKRIEVKANRRTYLLKPEQILFVQGLGNYTAYHLNNGEKLVAYGTIKAAMQNLPDEFLRLHKSYIVNRHQIASFTNDEVCVGQQQLPRGKELSDASLLAPG